jgi:RNA-directed DNA polymerase
MNTKNNIISFVKENKVSLLKKHFGSIKFGVIYKKSHSLNEMKVAPFLAIDSPIHFANFLKIPLKNLAELINQPNYSSYSIPKKKGGKRNIEAPSSDLKYVQSQINYYLQHYYLTIKPKNVHGFVIKDVTDNSAFNIIENARLHIKSRYVLTVDLKDFFSSISANRILQLFSSDLFDYSDNLAKALTFLCTYKGFLPTGSPASPVLSNFVCLELDQVLLSFCNQNQLTYSRYADDLTFSSNYSFTDTLMVQIRSIIEDNRFKINEKKVRVKSSNRKQIVTGLIVNDQVNVNRKTLKLLRAILHDCKVNGLDNGIRKHYKLIEEPSLELKIKFLNKLKGHINFVKQVRGEDFLFRKLNADFKDVFKSI